MKKRFTYMAAALLIGLPAAAQETYENAKIATEDLNGTARYVGMGGATDALGAEISSIGSNPAAIGLFRHSKVEGSAGMVTQQDAADYSRGDATNLSFDQIGVVWSKQTGERSFLNVAFNYHKSRNFDFILSADDKLNAASQNKLTYMKHWNFMLYNSDFDGNVIFDRPYITCNQLDDIYMRNLLPAAGDGKYYFYEASLYDFDRAHSGYIGEYDFNVSGNIDDRVYLGLTLGIHDVHYHHSGDYTEAFNPNPENIETMNVWDNRKITGTGVDLKLGMIVRPIEYSPLLIGASVSTPTFYDLTTSNYTEVSDGNATVWAKEPYDFKLYTPWKFGLSLGYTVGQFMAIGAGFDYADYGHMDTRVNDGGSYDYYDYYESSSSDDDMNDHTKEYLKGVSTVKLGVEVKPIPEIALRAGYNYVSAMYDEDGYKDGTINSYGTSFASATDYTNWKSTNRFTLGVGYKFGRANLDLAYQFSSTSGKFAPFMNYVDNQYVDYDNVVNQVTVNNKRHQILCTIGYTF